MTEETVTPPVETPEVKEKTNWKNTAIELQKKAQEIEQKYQESVTKLQQIEEAQLQAQNNYKQLYETEKRKREAAEIDSKKIKDSYINGIKISAVKEHAIKMGIQDQAIDDLDLLDKSIVQAEFTSTGRVNVLGAQEFVENLKNQRPYWFRDNATPVINNQTGTATVKKDELSANDILELQKKDPAAYKQYMNKVLQKPAK